MKLDKTLDYLAPIAIILAKNKSITTMHLLLEELKDEDKQRVYAALTSRVRFDLNTIRALLKQTELSYKVKKTILLETEQVENITNMCWQLTGILKELYVSNEIIENFYNYPKEYCLNFVGELRKKLENISPETEKRLNELVYLILSSFTKHEQEEVETELHFYTIDFIKIDRAQ